MINQLTKRDKLRGGTGLNRCAGEDGKWDGLWINGGATCSVRLEMGMCPQHELTSSAEGLLHNKDISLLFIYIDFPVKCVLALGIPTEQGRKISFFPRRVKKSWVMNLVFSEKRDRSRGLAVHCLLERKNWKCIIKREENIKASETEKLWLGGVMCKKKKLSKRQIDEVSAVKGIIIWESEIWFYIYPGLLYFRQVLQTPKHDRHNSFLFSLLQPKQQTLSRAGRSAGLCWEEFLCLSWVSSWVNAGNPVPAAQTGGKGAPLGCIAILEYWAVTLKHYKAVDLFQDLPPFLLMEKLD